MDGYVYHTGSSPRQNLQHETEDGQGKVGEDSAGYLKPCATKNYESTQVTEHVTKKDQGEDDSFDSLLYEVSGAGGLWQVCIILFTSYTSFLCGVNLFSMVFKADEPDHWCSPPANFSRLSRDQYVPCETSEKSINHTACTRSRCLIYETDASGLRFLNTTKSCESWTYDTSTYQSTIVTEWDLVCENSAWRPTAFSTHMLAGMVGAIFFGPLGDRYGRSRLGKISTLLFLAAAPLTAASPNLEMFLVTTALSAAAQNGMYACFYTLSMEVMGRTWRPYAGIFWVVPWALGIMTVSLLAWLLRSWWHLQLAVAASVLPMLPGLLLLPESPRWLAIRSRHQEALLVLQQAARLNRRQLPAEPALLARLERVAQRGDESAAASWGPLREARLLLGSRRMLTRCLATVWLWIVIAGVYYGVSFDTAQLADSAYVAMLLAGLVELPSLLAAPLIDCFGRRTVTVVVCVLGSASILLVLAVPSGWPALLLGLLGKLSVGTGYGVIYIYLEEYMPTSVRTTALGLACTAEGAGGAISPYVAYALGKVQRSAPSVLFSLAAISAAVSTFLFLPETLGTTMPETVEDVEHPRQRDKKERYADVKEVSATP